MKHQATYEGHLLRTNNQERPFVLSRAFFAGSQRFGEMTKLSDTFILQHTNFDTNHNNY